MNDFEDFRVDTWNLKDDFADLKVSTWKSGGGQSEIDAFIDYGFSIAKSAARTISHPLRAASGAFATAIFSGVLAIATPIVSYAYDAPSPVKSVAHLSASSSFGTDKIGLANEVARMEAEMSAKLNDLDAIFTQNFDSDMVEIAEGVLGFADAAPSEDAIEWARRMAETGFH